MSRNPQPAIGPRVPTIPAGDDRERMSCPECGFIHYENPKVVVGSVAHWDGRILLCRRAINPRKGFWTLPAGYLELNETVEAGAHREAWEEARARLALEGVLAVFNIPRLSQVQIIYRARLLSSDISAGPESQEVRLFTWDELPWSELAFPSVRWALHHDRDVGAATVFAARSNPPDETGDF
ncbi:MAG: NUDIX hydrolase [Alphaproteobacteria bacterium]|nr:NUDIX hydrolase [Alphaproteobacteria bacterium]